MSIAIRRVALVSSMCALLLQACSSEQAPAKASAAPSATQRTAMTQGHATPPAGAPGRPAYMDPRADGTYVDAQGNILTPPP
ncbi:MAG: hypothetical protein ACKPEA_12915, partial [Planctomycetota bacterium]